VAVLGVSTFAARAAGGINHHALSVCSLGTMTLRLGGLVSEKTGEQRTSAFVLTSRASTPCVLDGYPSVALFDREGRLLPFHYAHDGDEMITGARPKPVTMRLGISAYFAVNKTGCDAFNAPVARTLRLRLPSSHDARTIHLRPYSGLDYCGGSRVTVSPFERHRGGWACVLQGSCQRRD
jgi:Domain of unknown function (DUF4232)